MFNPKEITYCLSQSVFNKIDIRGRKLVGIHLPPIEAGVFCPNMIKSTVPTS